MDKLKYYTDMEAYYRKQAGAEPALREQHTADAEAWRRLADMRALVSAKQSELKELFAQYGINRAAR